MKELFTARGRLLIRVIEQPGITIERLARDLFLTKRSIYGMVGELLHAGYLIVEKEGKIHRYVISSFGLAELKKLTEGGQE